MEGERDNKLTRREFMKWSFGILTVAMAAGTQATVGRLREADAQPSRDREVAGGASLTREQCLQSRPSLSPGFTLRGESSSLTLKGQELTLVVNESAYLVLSRCDGDTTVRELCNALVAHFYVSFERAQEDLVGFLNCMYGLNAMTVALAYRLDDRYATQKSGKSRWATITT
jgi:hypothetical protein